jgi:hypothetical protein
MRLTYACLLAAICALLIAACGSSKPAHHTSPGFSKQYAAARCMRRHGIQNFPDPDSYGGNPVSYTPGSGVITIANIPFSGPAFSAAEKACDPLGLGQPRPAISEQQKQQLIAFAQCMRRHGLTQWSDPTFPAGGGFQDNGESRYSRSDPKVIAASAACNRR